MKFTNQWTSEKKLIELLDRRFGEGIAKAQKNGNRGLFHEAVRLGFIGEDGHITSKGRGLLEDRAHH